MAVNQLLRTLLARCPWLLRTLNYWLPTPALQLLRQLAEKFKCHNISAVHELPAIFHYWSNRYVLPLLQQARYQSLDDFFLQHIARFRDEPLIRIVSSGNCEQDIRLVHSLLNMGISNLRYECLEFNPAMLERAREQAYRQLPM